MRKNASQYFKIITTIVSNIQIPWIVAKMVYMIVKPRNVSVGMDSPVSDARLNNVHPSVYAMDSASTGPVYVRMASMENIALSTGVQTNAVDGDSVSEWVLVQMAFNNSSIVINIKNGVANVHWAHPVTIVAL